MSDTSLSELESGELSRRSRIFIAGHRGLIGSALLRLLQARGYTSLITVERGDLDLTNQQEVEIFFSRAQPEFVLLAAGRAASGVEERRCPADVIRDHLTIQANVIDSAYTFGARRLLMIAPREAAEPAPGPQLLSAAKWAGTRMCSAYRAQFGFMATVVVTPSVYGPHDRFIDNRPGSVAGYIYSLFAANLRGDSVVRLPGQPRAVLEVLHADDLARAMLLLLPERSDEEMSAVTGQRIDLGRLVETIAHIAQFKGRLEYASEQWAESAPGPSNCSQALRASGWHPRIDLPQGLASAYEWLTNHQQCLRI